MAPKTPKSEPVPEVIAASVRRLRTEHDWTQEQLAEQMRAIGFKSWARSKVAEVEGKGRGRQVSVPELLGLAQVFDVGVLALLASPRLEIVEGHTLDAEELVDLVAGPEVFEDYTRRLKAAEGSAATEILESHLRRVYSVMIDRIRATADDLRDTAGWFETEAMDRLKAPIWTEEEK